MDPRTIIANPESSPEQLESARAALEVLNGKAAVDDAGFHWLAGNLVTTAKNAQEVAERKPERISVSPAERDLARKIYHRVSEMLKEAGHSVNPQSPHYMVTMNKYPQGDIKLNVSYEGFVGCSDDRAQTSIEQQLRGAASALRIRVRDQIGDHLGIVFDNLIDAATVVNATTREESKKIDIPESAKRR